MNIREYIESGVIELYVMNALTAQEAAEVAAIARQYPEIQAEIDDAERAMQAYAQAHSIAPRPELKDEILNKIKNDTGIDSLNEKPEPINTIKPPLSILSFLPWGIAVVLGISTLLLYNNYRTLKADKEKCEQEQNVQLLKNQKAIADVEFKLNVLKNPETKVVKLTGLPLSPESKATVYWNAKEKITYLTIQKLPNPGSEKQFQLWAIVNNTPIDAGVFNADTDILHIMKGFDKVDNFGVTLEPLGGSKEPTMTALHVFGAPD